MVIDNIRARFRNEVGNRTLLDINELIRDALLLEQDDLRKHKTVVHVEPDQQLPPVRADRIQLQQVLLNLISNAVAAMVAREEPRVLHFKSTHEDDSVMVSIADTGSGAVSSRGSRNIDVMFLGFISFALIAVDSVCVNRPWFGGRHANICAR